MILHGLRSKTQIQGLRPNENQYNVMKSQLYRARQFNRFTAARTGRMYSWFAAQQSLVERVSGDSVEETDEANAILPSTVFRPICSKEAQLLLTKEVVGSIVKFSVALTFSVFRGAVARDQTVCRKIRVSKSMGINSPAEAVSRISVIFLEWVPPVKVACTNCGRFG